jgi:glucose-1-phosphate cytidylyltransferase
VKVVILAGGIGSRLSEETVLKPKPMVEIGGKPIIWHIMKLYSHYGCNDFIICLGYKGYMIKEYFSNYFLHMTDITIDMSNNKVTIHNNFSEPWKVTMVDTGNDTMTGGRLKMVERYTGNKTFMMTYGDGVSNVNIRSLLQLHKKCKKHATLTAIQTAGRFGVLDIGNDCAVKSFLEKPKGEGSWINAGFFVLEPEIFKYIDKGSSTIWERAPLEKLVAHNKLAAYKHDGFWKCMDTLRDKKELEMLWDTGHAEWKVWE